MLITRECDYAVRVVRALADGRRMSVGEICEKEFITAPFAYKILKKLQKAGIVKGFRGVHGGYSLNRVAKELTLYDVYTAIDPEFFIIDCLEPGYQCTCDGSGNQICTVHRGASKSSERTMQNASGEESGGHFSSEKQKQAVREQP